VPTGSPVSRFPSLKALACYFYSDLRSSSVRSPWQGNIPYLLCSRLARSPSGWLRTIAANAWFQSWAVRQLRPLQQPALNVFSYSYVARWIVRLGRHRVYLLSPAPCSPHQPVTGSIWRKILNWPTALW
jgi:hypothetical protein